MGLGTVIVFGGDGFCGWPTSLHLSNAGYDVVIVDNLSRRRIEKELGAASLTPISTLPVRTAAWQNATGKHIACHEVDAASDYDAIRRILADHKPIACVHFAEQRAAPYSMKSSWHKSYTISNNLNATNNILAAIVDVNPDIHCVHLGTMGVYGYGAINAVIPEGYVKVLFPLGNGDFEEREILHPADPGSIYHLTKVQDALLFQFYAKNDKLRISDLHQGIVWGTQTAETEIDERLINRFDYDGDYGTVLNRFLMQAALGHPLTVYGIGRQTRAFIHLRDSVYCIRRAIETPPDFGDRVRIINQVTETHRIVDLAHVVRTLTGAPIQYVANPRTEAQANELAVVNQTVRDFGIQATTLQAGLMQEIVDVAERYRDRCDLRKIPCVSYWSTERASAAVADRVAVCPQ